MNQFTHIYIDNNAENTLFLLHGSGGTENDFLFLDELLEKKYNLVGLRGNILEKGMNRFFRRLSEGVFDQESINDETKKLRYFIKEWVIGHNLTLDDLIFLGYSNGANMILAMLFNYPDIIRNSVLLHPMLRYKPSKNDLDLESHVAFLSYGRQDHLIPEQESKDLVKLLTSLNMNLTVNEYASGHEITEAEINDVVQYLLTVHSSEHTANKQSKKEQLADESGTISLRELQEKERGYDMPELEKSRPHVTGEQSAAGSMPNPEYVTAKTTLEKARSMRVHKKPQK